MPYIVIRKLIKTSFSFNTPNPGEEELLDDLKPYDKVYLLESFDEAKKAADIFFHAPRLPKVGGAYGLIAEVDVEMADVPAHQVDFAIIYNNWVDSQSLGYDKTENTGISCTCREISPAQIKSISHTFIPDYAKQHNPNFQDTQLTHKPSWCFLV